MNVNVRVLLSVLPEATGYKELEVEFAGDTANDLEE
jgi:hypothetical protein